MRPPPDKGGLNIHNHFEVVRGFSIMAIFSRRTFMAGAISVAATRATLPTSAWAVGRGRTDGEATRLDVSVEWDRAVSSIPEDMLGLSYESYQLSAPDFFSVANTELIALFRKLSPNGVLRLGGNLSEYTVWIPDDAPAPPAISFQAIGPDPSSGRKIPQVRVTPEAVRNLRDFLDATGWRTIYGLNLAMVDHPRIAEEAKFVAGTLGARLIAFQIGNEPDHYVMNGLRRAGYDFDDYFAEWKAAHGAVLQAVPSAKFAGPDVAEDLTWVAKFAEVAPASVAMLTGHRYAEGPPSDPSVTLEKLLAPDPAFVRRMKETEKIARASHIPFAMTETNSCFKAGKEGVSDVFGSALWAMDYFLQLAASGARGAYFHGGANGWYTPIAGGSGKPFVARPIYFGLEMSRRLSGSELATVHVAANLADVSVYALRNPRRLVVINKGCTDVSMKRPAGIGPGVVRLLAPSPEAKDGIQLSAQRDEDGALLLVPIYSAAVFG